MKPIIAYRDPGDQPITWWWVVFADHAPVGPRAPAWVHLVTRRDFRHVWAFKAVELGTAILDPMLAGVDVRWTPWAADKCAQACLEAGHRVVRLAQFDAGGYSVRGLITCVSVVKSAIGLKSSAVITPFQLYRELLRQGAFELARECVQ